MDLDEVKRRFAFLPCMDEKLMEQVKKGRIPDDYDLLFAIKWFEETRDRIFALGERYYLAYDGIDYQLRTLQRMAQLRGLDGKT